MPHDFAGANIAPLRALWFAWAKVQVRGAARPRPLPNGDDAVKTFSPHAIGAFIAVTSASAWFATAALAEEVIGRATPGQLGFQPPVTPIDREIQFFHNDILMPIITAICVFVLGLLIYCAWRFNEKANPVPTRTTHNTLLEVAWTVTPVMILVVIAAYSFPLLTHQLTIPPADIVVKATGKQWYWSYTYPKSQAGGFEFDSNLKPDEQIDTSKGEMRLLTVDNEVVVPINKVVQVQVTADPTGVIHGFVVQSLGIRMDAVPGRLNETWFKAEHEGVFYGQCSKLCGQNHAYMPITVRVVSEDAYKAWLVDAAKKYASADAPRSYAAAEPTR